METGCEPPRVVAGMPMYNEEETIGTVVTMALRHVDEVICIDDGSSDSSARIAEACGATVIRHRGNQGYGAALKTLFKAKLFVNIRSTTISSIIVTISIISSILAVTISNKWIGNILIFIET